MIAAVLRTALWVGVGNALAGAAILAFLYTPESNAVMLAVSAALLLTAALLLILSSASAAHALVHRQPPRASLGAAVRALPLALLGLAIIGLLCGATGWAETWWLARAGEVDAAAIAAGDITDTRPLHAAARWAVALVQWVLVPAWLATCLAWIAGYERRDVLGLKWLTAALHWRLLLVALVSVVVLVWLPWRWVYWRPRTLPASSVEIVFAAVKVSLIYLSSQVAWALTLWTASRRVVATGAAINVLSGTATLPPDQG